MYSMDSIERQSGISFGEFQETLFPREKEVEGVLLAMIANRLALVRP